MEKKNLIRGLIGYLIIMARNMPRKDWLTYAYKNNIDAGICWVGHAVFKKAMLYTHDWVKYWASRSNGGGNKEKVFWAKPVRDCKTREEALQTIEHRIFLLTMELESGIE